MIRRWLGLCENRHEIFPQFLCKLGYGHAGSHHFGFAQAGNFRFTLDGPPIVSCKELPTEVATPRAEP